ncbi:MAG TPA: hypothetical protein VHO49_02810, partial [Anaerolineales bacterium]|nr:hypothetical protein [Anaerolineales bacterium]
NKFSFVLPFLFFLLAAQDPPPVAISSPVPGEALRGQVNIIGSTNAPDFISAQLDFAYASDPTGTWFPLQTLPQSVFDSPLFTWDTSLITDGDYILRLRVFAGDGSFQEVTVPVSIRNDAIPTATPAATAIPEEGTVLVPTPFLLAASQTPTDVPRSTPTPLPTNPVSLDSTTILLSLGRGALVLLGMFALAGLILRIRRF